MEKVLNAMPNAKNEIKAQKVLEINVNHAIYNKLKELYKEDKQKIDEIASVLYSMSALVAGLEVDNIQDTLDTVVNMLSM